LDNDIKSIDLELEMKIEDFTDSILANGASPPEVQKRVHQRFQDKVVRHIDEGRYSESEGCRRLGIGRAQMKNIRKFYERDGIGNLVRKASSQTNLNADRSRDPDELELIMRIIREGGEQGRPLKVIAREFRVRTDRLVRDAYVLDRINSIIAMVRESGMINREDENGLQTPHYFVPDTAQVHLLRSRPQRFNESLEFVKRAAKEMLEGNDDAFIRLRYDVADLEEARDEALASAKGVLERREKEDLERRASTKRLTIVIANDVGHAGKTVAKPAKTAASIEVTQPGAVENADGAASPALADAKASRNGSTSMKSKSPAGSRQPRRKGESNGTR
jgi:hypothetical protein